MKTSALDKNCSCDIGSSSIMKAFILAAFLSCCGGLYKLPTSISFQFIDSWFSIDPHRYSNCQFSLKTDTSNASADVRPPSELEHCFAQKYSQSSTDTWSPFYWHGLTLILAWVSNYTHFNVWDAITYPFPTVEVIPSHTVYVVTYPCWD